VEQVRFDILENIGLTRSEINVYLALLEIGASSTGKIVDKSGTSSSKIYEVLERLIAKGLVSFVIDEHVKVFEAAAPERLSDYVEEKKKAVIQQAQQVEKILPSLKKIQLATDKKAETTIYRGIKGVETAFYQALDHMSAGDEVLALGITRHSEQIQRFFNKFDKACYKKNISARLLFNADTQKKNHGFAKYNPLADLRFIPQAPPATITILNDQAIIFPEGAQEPLIIVIKDKMIADAFRIQFNHWWNAQTIVEKGMDAYERMLDDIFDDLEPGEMYRVFGASWKALPKNIAEFLQRKHLERQERGIVAKLLFHQDQREEVEKRKETFLKAEVHYLPYSATSPLYIIPHNERTHILVPEEEPTIITINNAAVAAGFIRQFDELWNQDARILQGETAIEQLFELYLEGNEVFTIGARGAFFKMNPQYTTPWEARAKKKGLRMYNVLDPSHRKSPIAKLPFMTTRYTISSEFGDAMVISIMNNTVGISSWIDKEPLLVLIEKENIYKIYKNLFDHLWNQQNYVWTGNDAFDLLNEMLPSKKNVAIIGEDNRITPRKHIRTVQSQLPQTTVITEDFVAQLSDDAIIIQERKEVIAQYQRYFNSLWKK